MVTASDVERRARPRLVGPLRGASVVLLEAPGGYGKTTVADLLVQSWEHAALRVRLREATTIDGLLGELRRGARRAGLRTVEEAATGSSSYALDDAVGALAAHGEPITLVFDDVHHLDDAAQRMLADALLDAAGNSARLVAAHLGAVRLHTDDLRLDRDEQRSLFGDAAPPDGLLDEVAQATGGWAAAVALAAARWSADPAWTPSTPAGSRAVLRDLVAELIAADPAVALVAIAPLIDDEVCDLLGGPTLASAAARAGVVAPGRDGWATVPDPIAAAIVDLGLPSVTDEVLGAIARHYRRRGEVTVAVRWLDRSRRPAALVALLHDAPWEDLAACDPLVLADALDGLDDHGPIASHPILLVAAAQAFELSDPERRTDLLARVRRLTGTGSTADGAVDRAARAEQARDSVAIHDLAAVEADVAALECEAGDGEELTVARARTALARAQVFACTTAGMRAGAATYARAAATFERAGAHAWLAETLARRGYTALFFEGRMLEGAAEVQRALALLPAGDVTRGIWLANYADVLDTIGRLAEADAAVAEVLDIGRRFDHAALLGMAWWSRSWIASRRGDAIGTETALIELERDLHRWARPGQAVEVHASSAECWARLGDAERSAAALAQAHELAIPIGYLGPWAVANARHLALFGDPDDAIAQLDALDPDGTEGVIPISGPGRDVLRALAEARRGHHERARDLTAHAREASAGFGVPDLVDRLEAEAIRRLEAIVSEDLPAGDAGPDRSVAASPPVIHLLDGFAVKVGGRDATPHPGFPSLLVKLLAVQGSMTAEAAIDALWPDADASTGRSRLRNLLNRLRSRSGDLVVRDADLLRLHPEVTTDVEAFERQATGALTATASERVGLARLAVALYPGPLLPGDIYEDWAAGTRERLKRRFLALIDLVAADAVERGDADEAIRLLDVGIDAEPLDQGRYQAACQVLVASDRVGSARTVARRAVATMAEIGIDPAPDLLALAGG